MYEHIPGVWTRTCGETLSQNRTECVHAPQTACQGGMFHPRPGNQIVFTGIVDSGATFIKSIKPTAIDYGSVCK